MVSYRANIVGRSYIWYQSRPRITTMLYVDILSIKADLESLICYVRILWIVFVLPKNISHQ